MAKKKIQFMCTAFRDGFQSVYGARVLTRDFLPAVEAAYHAGIDYFESGGGARFQSLFFYCNENAFDMMDAFRKAAPNANLQTLARGVNVVGLDSQSSDIIRLHAQLFKKHGVTTIRNFDALNDINNLTYSGQCIVDAGLKHEPCITIMELPPGCSGSHDADYYENVLKGIVATKIPFDSICFKDASGTAVPSKVYEMVKRARKMLPENTIIHFHTHETAGIGVAAYMAALNAGADMIDLSLAPCSGGTAQTDVLTMWHALKGSEFDIDIDVDKIRDTEDVFKECMKGYFLPPEAVMVEPLIPWSPMPGGALTANTQMLRDNNIMNKYTEIIKAMREVVEKGGFGTSVTPVSQFYFQQAFNNVMFGPWKKIAEGYGKMVLGYFGRTPVAPDPGVVKLASEQLKLEPTQKTVLEINDADPNKGVEAVKKMLKNEGLSESEENIFIVATCKEKGIKFLKGDAELGIRNTETEAAPAVVEVSPKEEIKEVEKEEVKEEVKEKTPVEEPTGEKHEVTAEMPGKVFSLAASIGDRIEEGDAVIVIEAMKMEMDIASPVTGTVTEILVKEGDQVAEGDVLAYVVG